MNPLLAEKTLAPKVKSEADRAFPRRAAKGTVVCRTGKLGMGRALKGKLVDISPDGAGIALSKEIAFGEHMELELQGIGSPRILVVPAEVRFVSCDSEGKCHIGVRFENDFHIEN